MLNHAGTVQVITICNAFETAMDGVGRGHGASAERWIPKGVDVSYTAKAPSDITCIDHVHRRGRSRGLAR